MNKFNRLWGRTLLEIPGARIVERDQSRFMRFVFFLLTWLVKIFTLGKGNTDWGDYTTTMWRTIYVPKTFWSWSDNARYQLLRHELVHMRQFRAWPIKALDRPYLWYINALMFSFAYMFLPLPVLWTYRAKFEREGYEQSLLSYYELFGASEQHTKWEVNHLKKIFGGSDYFYMWNEDDAAQWVRETQEKIEKGLIKNDRDNVLLWQ